MNSEEQSWVAELSSAQWNQKHLIDQSEPEGIRRLVVQLKALNAAYPGGLLEYIKRSRKLLAASRDGVNLFSGLTPSVPAGERLVTGSAEFNEFEALGLDNVHKVAFVLVAGGLGERLGYPGIKIGLPIETCTGMTYIEYYIRMILEFQRCAESQSGKRPKLPLAIMTSEDTHEKTLTLLRTHQYFGMPVDQVTIMKQEKVPALIDNEARFATMASDRYVIDTKPHGHGDVHTLLNSLKLPAKWLAEGLEWVLMFQDTNGLVSHAICPMVGVSIKRQFALNSLVVPRRAGEAVGAVCKLENNNGCHPLTINVEYNQLTPLLVASGKGSDQPDAATGMSPFPGNTNVLLFHLPRYSEILELTGGSVPEFVNPKYKDDTKSSFKMPTRIECLMQEFPRLLGPNDKVGITELDRWLCFSTVKNQVSDAAVKSKSGGTPESAFTGESDEYFCYSKLLEIAASSAFPSETVDIAQPKPATFLDVHYQLGPKVVMYPSFAVTLKHVKRHMKGGPIKLAQDSTLILEGDVDINGLEVEGALILRASEGKKLVVKQLKVSNKGWEAVELEKDGAIKECDMPPHLQIRGFNIRRHEQTELATI